MSRRFLAVEALRCHRVLTMRQLDRLYGIPARVLSGLPRRTLTVTPVHMRASLWVDATFVALDGEILNKRHGDLTHLVGTAEMQVPLGVPLDGWRLLPSGRARGNRPDAEYDHPNGQGLVAIEYDSGAYPWSLVTQKLKDYHDQGYLHTMWGVASAGRLRHLEDLVPTIIEVPWWISEPRNGWPVAGPPGARQRGRSALTPGPVTALSPRLHTHFGGLPMNNDNPDSRHSEPVDTDHIIDAIPALNPPPSPTLSTPQSRNNTERSAQKRTKPARPVAWTRDELPHLPRNLQRPTYLRLRQEIMEKRLDGLVLNDQPLRIEVPVEGNGTRARTFQQLVLQPSADLKDRLDRLYAEVWREVTVATGGRHLTLEEALRPEAQPPRALMKPRKSRRTPPGDGPDRGR